MDDVSGGFWQKFFIGIFSCLAPALSFAHITTISSAVQPVILSSINYNAQDKSWWIHLSGVDVSSLPVRHFFLYQPSRLVIDINHAAILQNSVTTKDLAYTPVINIRSSARPQNLRIVLDLRGPIPPDALKIAVASTAAHAPHNSINHDAPTITAKRSRDIIVVIDPGHGGKDPGATGIKRIQEKVVVLNIAKKLQDLINQQPGFKAVLTRDGDYYLTLRERLLIARKNKADMFVAIHADAYPDPLAHGFSVFALSQRGATSEAARWLAARENQSELMGGVDLSDKEDVLRSVLLNLSQTATIQASLSIGQNLLDKVQPFAHLHHNHIEQAAFVVLKSPDIPSLLIETGFLSNNQEEGKLSTLHYQYSLANAIMLGIKQYFTHRPPPGTWLASRDTRFKDG
jgi:N-acetylmuramoyl-L-alanine amidase